MFLTPLAAVAVLAAGAVAAIVGSAAIPVFAASLVLSAVLAAFGVIRAPHPRELALHREAPDVGQTGREDRVGLRIRNPGAGPAVVAVRDAAPPSARRIPRAHMQVVEAGGTVRFTARIRPERRGKLPLGPVTVRTSIRGALAGRQATVPLRGRVKVYPPLPSRREVALRLDRARLLQSGERSTALRGGGSEFDSLRDYHPDDEFRRINWRATARSTRPISNVFREERNQQVMLLFDCGRTMATTVGSGAGSASSGVSRFELALDAGFAVAELAARVGDHVGMLAFASSVIARIPPRSGRSHPRRILDQLYDVEPRLEAPNYRGAFAQVLDRNRRRALLVLLTELSHPEAMDGLFDALPALRARHLVIVASLRDPGVESLARRSAASSEEVYAKAAAAVTLARREDSARRLSRLGATVVDRPPGALGGALADAYLRIKAGGRL